MGQRTTGPVDEPPSGPEVRDDLIRRPPPRPVPARHARVLLCNIAEHYGHGMRTSFVVTD